MESVVTASRTRVNDVTEPLAIPSLAAKPAVGVWRRLHVVDAATGAHAFAVRPSSTDVSDRVRVYIPNAVGGRQSPVGDAVEVSAMSVSGGIS